MADLEKATAGRIGKSRGERLAVAARLATVAAVVGAIVGTGIAVMWASFSHVLLAGASGRPHVATAAGIGAGIAALVVALPLVAGAFRKPPAALVIVRAGGSIRRWGETDDA